VLVVLVVFAGSVVWAARHPTLACACGPQISFSRDQPGFHRIGGAVAAALAQLPVRVRVDPRIGAPAGVYRGDGSALVLYRARSRFGVFRFSAWRRPPGFGGHSLHALATECDVCSENGLVALAPGVRGALLVGGNGPNSVTWLQGGLEMVVLGPAATFSEARAVGAARALARANARG
jgi:hypothetical protein